MICRYRRDQRLAARGAGTWKMVDGDVRGFNPAQRLAGMAVLPASLLVRPFPQTADTRRLLQAIA